MKFIVFMAVMVSILFNVCSNISDMHEQLDNKNLLEPVIVTYFRG